MGFGFELRRYLKIPLPSCVLPREWRGSQVVDLPNGRARSLLAMVLGRIAGITSLRLGVLVTPDGDPHTGT
jgi:hypothetical protein